MPLHRLAFATVFLLLFISGQQSQAQQSFNLEIRSADNSSEVINKINYPKRFTDSLTAIRLVNDVVRTLHEQGYLLARQKEVEIKDNMIIAYVQVGSLFEWLEIRPGNLNSDLWRKLNYKQSNFRNRPFRIGEISKLEKRMLSYAERNGFPFASVKFDSLQIIGEAFSAALNVDFGPKITFDSVTVVQQNILKSKFAGAYLGIQLGDPYDQQLVNAVVPKLRRLPYLKLPKAPVLSFQNNEGKLTLDVEKRAVNTIDGIIGFLPNNSRESGLLITGQFDLDLYNPFTSGKHIGLHWRRLSEETQTLEMNYDHPNLLGSALSLKSQFDFLKQDTTFNRRVLSLDFNLNLGINSNLGVITHITATDLTATSRFQNGNQLPDILDFRLTRYGLRYSINTLDDVFFPRAGFTLEVSGSVGNKIIRPNSELPNELYEGTDLKTLQYQYDFSASHYKRLGVKSTLLSAFNAGILSSENLFQNDAYRIGGLNSLRGFNEGYYFATSFAYLNLETRFYLDETSYLLLFTDVGYVEQDFVNQPTKVIEWPLGVGTGISFATNSGIFNFVYALGTSNSTGAINFNQSKIHFGFTTRF